MPYIPFVYFICLAAFFYTKRKRWGIEIAATCLLIVISFFSIMIDINDVYGDYGINYDNMTIPTICLYCIQWTFVLVPLHYLSGLDLSSPPQIKVSLLYVLFVIIALSSFTMIATSMEDIRDALVMDMIDVYQQHINDISSTKSGAANYLMFLPQILVTTPFPTLALFLWFYMKTFMKCPVFLEIGILIASIAQAILAIVIAGRSAIVFWTFDFFLLFSYFYHYLSKSLKRKILVAALVMGTLIGSVFISITISRFDDAKNDRDPFVSLYGYAGQQVNNFCTMIIKGADSPFQISRIFPLTGKITGQSFDLMEHYQKTATQVDAAVNVFDTFGGELYLDLGWFGYVLFFILLSGVTFFMKMRMTEMEFHNIFILVIFVAFYTRSLFSWPFTGHYTTIAILLVFTIRYMFKYIFKI